jgi:hypothetical protein
MFRVLIKLAIAVLIANAALRIGSAYASYYRFKDAVNETVLYGKERGDDQLRARILELAGDYDLPMAEDSFTIRHEENHTIADGAFTRPIDVLPNYHYPWHFTWHVDTYTLNGLK